MQPKHEDETDRNPHRAVKPAHTRRITTVQPTTNRRVRLLADGRGYYAAMVDPAFNWYDGEREPESDRVIRTGPECDAGLIARSRAIDWAASLGVPFEDD